MGTPINYDFGEWFEGSGLRECDREICLHAWNSAVKAAGDHIDDRRVTGEDLCVLLGSSK